MIVQVALQPGNTRAKTKSKPSSDLAEIRQHRVDHFKGLINFFSDLCACKDNLARDENEQDNLGLHHTVDETGEKLRLVGAEVVMARSQTLKTDGELDVARPDNVLDLKVRELGVETELLNDTGVLARRELGVVLRLCTGNDHLSGCEDQGSRLGITDTHNHCSKTLWIVLCVAGVQGDRLKIETAVEIDRCNDISLYWKTSLSICSN